MALDELVATIEMIKQRTKDPETKKSLAANETRTRQVLIDPLLLALGWDVSDPSVVELEYSAGHGRADYALLGQDGPVAVVEAKRLNDDMDNHVMQALNYANSRGIKFMVVTNGDDWRMYDVFEPKPIEEKIIMEFSVLRTPTHKSALKSLGMWRPNLASGSTPIAATSSFFVTEEVQGSYQINDQQEELVDGNVLTEETLDGDWRDLAQLSPDDVKDTDPTALKIDGDIIPSPPEYWNMVLVHVADWLIDKKLFDPDPGYKTRSANKRYLIHTDPIHADGVNFRSPKELNNDMYIETHGGAPQCVSRCKFLLKEFGQGVGVEVKFE